MSNKKKRTQLSTAELLRLRSSIITMLDTANKSIQPERQVTLASAIEVANREIRKEVYGSNSTRVFSALRAVSGFIALSSKNKVSTSSLENSDLLSVGHPLSTRAHAMTASALRHARARWIAADDLIIDDDIRALVASAHSYEHGSFERKHAFARIAALGPGVVPITAAVDLEPIIAVLGFGLGGNSRAARSARARMQRRDRFGRFAFMGGGWKFNIFKSGKHSYVSGKVVGMSGVDDIEVEIKDDKNIPNGVYAVPAKKGQSAKAIIKKSYLKDTPEVAVSREDQKYAVNFSSMRKLDAPTGWTPTQASQPNHVAFMSADGYRVEIPINKDGQQEITGARKASVFRAVGNQKIGMADGWDSVELTALTDQDQYEKFLNSKQGQKLLSQGGWDVDVVQEDIGEDKFKPAGETTGPGDRPGPVPPAVQRMADEENKRRAAEGGGPGKPPTTPPANAPAASPDEPRREPAGAPTAQLDRPAPQLEKADVKSVSVDWKTDGEPVTQEGLDAWKQEFAPGVDIKLQDDGSVKLTGSESNLRNALDKATDGDYNATDYIMDSAQLESMGVPTDRVLLDVEKMKNAVKGLTYKQLMDTGVKEYKMASKNVGAYWFTEDEVYDAEKDGFRLTGEERGGGKAMVDMPSYATPSGNLVDFAGDASMSKIGAVMQAYRNGDVLRFKYNGKDREVQPSGNIYTNKKTGETNFVGFDHAIGEERTFTISKMDAPSPKKEAKKEKAKIITMPEADRGKAPQFIKPDSTPEEVIDQMQKAIDGQYPVKFGYGGKDRTFRPERIYTSPKTGKTNIVGFSETDGEGRTFTADKVTGVSTPEAPAGWDVKRDEVQPSAAENVIDLNPKEVNKIADIKKFVEDAVKNGQQLRFTYGGKDRVVAPQSVWQNGQTGRVNLKAKDSDGTSKNFAWDKIVAPEAKAKVQEAKAPARVIPTDLPQGTTAEGWEIRVAGMYGGEPNAWTHIPPADEYGEDHNITEAVQKDGKSKFEVWRKGIWLGEGSNKQIADTDTLAEAAEAIKADMPNAEAIAIKNGKREPKAELPESSEERGGMPEAPSAPARPSAAPAGPAKMEKTKPGQPTLFAEPPEISPEIQRLVDAANDLRDTPTANLPAIIEKSIEEKKDVAFDFNDKLRVVTPEEIVENKAGKKQLKGFSKTDGEDRTFTIDKMNKPAADTNVKVDDIVNMPQDELDRLVDAAWPTPTAATPAYEEKVSEFDRQIADLNRKIETMKNVLNGPDSPDGKLHKRAKSNLDRLQQSKDKLSFDRINNNFEEKPAATTTRRLAVLPEGRSNEDIISEFEEDIPGGKARFTGDAQNGYPVFEFDIPAGEEERFNDWFGEDDIEYFPTGDAVAFAEKYSIPMGDNTELKNGNPGTSFEVDVAFEEGTLDDVLKDFKAKFPEGEADVVVSEGAGGGWPIVDFSVPEGREEDFGKWYNGDLADSDNIAGDLDEPVDENLFGGEPDAEDMGTFNDEAFDSMYTTPEGAYKPNIFEFYKPEGRTNQDSADYTDDPRVLSGKFSEDELVRALRDAVLPSDSGPANGYGNLPFESGDEPVKAEALFEALEQTGMDAGFLLAGIFDSASPDKSKKNQLNYVDTINTPPAGSPSAAIPLSDRLAQTRAAQAINGELGKPENAITAFRLISQHKETNPNIQDLAQELISRGINGLDLSQEGDADAQLARDLDTYLPWAFSESAEEREAFQSYWGLMLSIDGGDSDLEDWQHPGSRAIILDALERLTGGDGGKAMEMYYQLYEDFGGFKDLVDSKKAIADGVDDLESDTPAAGLFRLVAAAKEVSEIPLYRSIGVNANSELFKKYTTPGFVVSFDPRPFTETDLTTGEIGAVGFSPTNPNDVRIVFEVAAGEIDSVSLNGFSWYDQEQEHLGTGEFIVDSVREQPAVLKPGQNEYIITLKRATEDALKKAYGQPTEAEAPEVVEAPEAPTQGTAPREYGDVSDWKRVAGQAGSNQGGVYEDSEGNRYYVKTARSQDHADVETLGSALYRELGIPATDVGLGTRDGALQIISPMIPNATSGMDDYINDPEFLGKLHEGFAIDAWLSNYDVIGMVYDNVVADGNGNPIRVDQGGVLVWRARGSRKEWFGPEVAELDSMRDPGMNPTASDVFGSMTAADIKKSGEKLLNITPSRIDEIVDSIVNSPKENELLKDMLKRRRQSILDQLGIKDTTVDPFAERVPLTESIGYAAQDLQPGDVAEGDSFVIERVFRDQMTPKNKVSVQGYFPGHESQRKEWNETTIIPVARGGTIPPKGDKPALHRPKAPRKPSPGAFTGKMAELLKDAKTWEEAAAIIRKTPIMFFDYESTGLPGPEKGGRNQPVQIGGTFVADGEVRAQFSSYMNPEHELSDWSAKNLKQMDGSPVTDEWLTTQPSMKDAHQQFLDFVKEHAGDEVILGGQYTPFDLEILQRVLSANGLSINIVGTIDSKDLAEGTLPKWNSKTQFGASQVSEKDGKRRASNSLGPVAEFLEVKLPDWHRADADAQASWEITDAMLTRAINNPDTTPTTLLNVDGAFEAKQQEIADYENAYAKYEADLAEYVAAKAIAASWNCGGAGLTAAVGPANGPCSVPSVEQMIREAQPLPIGEIDPDGVAGGSTSNESSMVDAQEIDTPSQDGVDTNDPYKDEQFKPTEEQRAILDAIMEGKNVVVQALAGTGKTATLLLAGKRKKKEAAQERGVYIAFNKSAQLEAEERFRKAGLTNIEVVTNDAIATRWASKDIVKKLDKNPELAYYKDIDKYLGITEFEGPGGETYGLYDAHKFFMEAMRRYLISADPEIGPQHFDIPEEDVKPWMLDIVNKMWEDYKDPNGKLRMDNTIITKMWALSNPDLSKIGSGLKQGVDFIFFDEAQDINPVSGKVIADQTIQKVYVGDENQAIYGFRGGENQLGKVLNAVEFPLTKSWRFGANIAKEGNKWLNLLDAKHRVIGGNADPGEIIPQGSLEDTADAILVRTNSGGLSAIFDQLQRGRTVGVTKNYKKDLINLTDSAEYLINGGTGTKPKPMHAELAPFKTWAEVKKEAEDENSDASKKLKLFVGLVETEGIAGIRELLDQLHLAKGTGEALKSVDIEDTNVGAEGSLGKGVDYMVDENGIGVFGNTFENKSTIAKNGFKWDKSKGQWRLETTNQDTISNVLKKLSVSLNGGAAPTAADEKPIDVFVTTVHQAKGLEWDKVMIWNDFWGPRVDKVTGEVIMPEPTEFKIAYVAVTRAKKQLDRGALDWVDSFLKPEAPEAVEEQNVPETPTVPAPSTEGEGGGGVEEPPAPTPAPSDGGDDNERIIKSVKQAVKDADDTLEDYSDRSSKDEKNIKKFRKAVEEALYAYSGEQYVDAEERFRDAAELLEPYAEVGAGDLQSLMLQAADAADAIRISKLTPKETPAEQPKLDPEWRPDDVPAPLGVVPTGEQQAPDDVAPEQLETTNNNVDMSQVLRYKDDSEKAADLQNAFDDVEKSRDEVTGEDSVLMATDRNKIKKAAEEVRQIREALANGTMTDDQALARLNAIIDSLPTYDIFSERYVDMESFKDMVKAVKRYIDGSAYWRPTGAALPPIDAVDSKGRPAGYAKDGTTFLTPGMRVRTKFGYAGIVEEYEKTWGGVKVRMEIDPRPTEQKGAWGPYVARLAYNTRELTVIGPDEDPYVEITREKGSEKKKPKNLEQQMEIWNKVQAGEIDPKAKKSKAPKGEPPAEGEGGVGVEPPPSPPEGDGGSALPKAEAPEGAPEAPDTAAEIGDEISAPDDAQNQFNAPDDDILLRLLTEGGSSDKNVKFNESWADHIANYQGDGVGASVMKLLADTMNSLDGERIDFDDEDVVQDLVDKKLLVLTNPENKEIYQKYASPGLSQLAWAIHVWTNGAVLNKDPQEAVQDMKESRIDKTANQGFVSPAWFNEPARMETVADFWTAYAKILDNPSLLDTDPEISASPAGILMRTLREAGTLDGTFARVLSFEQSIDDESHPLNYLLNVGQEVTLRPASWGPYNGEITDPYDVFGYEGWGQDPDNLGDVLITVENPKGLDIRPIGNMFDEDEFILTNGRYIVKSVERKELDESSYTHFTLEKQEESPEAPEAQETPEKSTVDPEALSEMVDNALTDMHTTLYDQIPGMSATLVKMPVNETMMSIANVAGRPIVLVNINGVSVPFYASTGSGGKTSVPTNKWYPIFGISPQTGWFNKGFTEEQINNMYDSPELKAVADFLNANLANPLAMVPDIPKAAGGQEYEDLLSAINVDMDTTSGGSAKSAKILKQNIESTINDIKTPVIRKGWDPTLFRSGDQSTWPRFLLMADGITSRQDVAAAVRHGIEMIFERQEGDVRSQEEINKNAGAYFALLDQAIKENASDMYLGGDFDNSKKMKQLAEDWDFARPSLMNLDMFIDQMLNASTDPQVKKWKDRIQYMDATEESDYRLSLREGARLVTSDKIKLHGKSNSEVTPAGRPPVVIKDPKPISSSGLTGIPSLMEAVSTVVDRPDQYKERGVSAAVDSTDIEDLDIRASTIITPDGERKLRLRFKLTSWRGAEVTQEISSNLGQAGSLFRAEAPQIERVSVAENGDIVLSGESVVNNWGGAVFNNGRMFVSDSEDTGNPWSINIMRANDDNSLEPLDAQYESAPAAFHNQVIIDLPIDAEQSDIEEALRAAGVRDVRAAQQQDTKSLIENRLLSLFDSQTDPNINITDQDRRDKKLEKIKERWGVEAADVFPRIGSHGRIEYMLPDNVAFLMQEDTGIKGFKHNLSLEKAVANLVDTQSRPPTPEELIQVTTNAIVDVVTNGLVATVSRVQEGLNYKGMSSTEDLWTGGADYVFLRPTKHDENSTLEVMGGFNANSEGSIWWPATDIFERSDLYANIDDLYGKRVPGTDILRAVKYEGQEAMVKHGVPITKDAQIVVSQLVRDRAIKILKERGITEIDGTPIEEIILTAGSKILEDRRGSKDSAKGQLLRVAEENLTEAFTEAGGSETVDFNDLAAMLTYTGSDLHYQPAPAGSVAVAAKYMFTVDMGLDPFEIENTRQLPQIIVRYPDGHYYTHDAGSAGAVLSGDAYVEPMLASDVNVLRNKVAEYNSPFDRQEEEGKVDWLPFSGNHAVTNAGGYDTMLRAEIVIPFGQENAGNPTGEDYADILDRYKLVDEIIKKVAKMKSFEMYSAARGMLLPMYANTKDRNLQSYIMQQLINLTLYTGRTVPPMPVTSAGEEKDTNVLPLPDYDEFVRYGNYLNRAGNQAVLENVDGEYAGWLRAAYSAKIIRDFDDQGLPIRSYIEITTDRDGGLSFQLKENSGFKWDPNKREITFSSRGIMYKIRAIQPDEKLNRIQL